MDLAVTPADGPVDVAPALRLAGEAAGEQVTLTVSTTDAAGHRWRSVGVHRLRPDGALQLDDPEQPWWDMAYADQDSVPVAFTAPDDALEYTVSVSSPRGVAEAAVRRTWGAGLTRTEHRGDGWRLRVYDAAGGAGGRSAVLVVPGSTGVSAVAPTAALLAAHGYRAGVLGYLQEPGLPAAMCRIPTEVATAGLRAFADVAGVDAARIAVVAGSVGTALALAALSRDDAPRVGAVVALSPTHVVWQAIADGGPPPKASMLSAEGRDLPFVPLAGEKLIGQVLRNALTRRLAGRPRSTALRLLPAYAAGLAKADAVRDAALPVEHIAAPLLAVAGEDDAMWPSAAMARALVERRRAHGVGAADRLLLLPGTGHFLRPPITPTTVDRTADLVSGGDPRGIARGQRAAWDATLELLGRTVGAP